MPEEASTGISTTCPDCGAGDTIASDQLDREFRCERCGTTYLVRREVRRRRVAGAARSRDLRLLEGAGPSHRRLVVFLFAVIGLLATAGLLYGLLVIIDFGELWKSLLHVIHD